MFIATENLTAQRFRPGACGSTNGSPVKSLGQWYFFEKVNLWISQSNLKSSCSAALPYCANVVLQPIRRTGVTLKFTHEGYFWKILVGLSWTLTAIGGAKPPGGQ